MLVLIGATPEGKKELIGYIPLSAAPSMIWTFEPAFTTLL